MVGAGFAGLSAAVRLADMGTAVTLVEARPAPGGRAYSFHDVPSGDVVDNGQHLLMGCYTQTLAFLRRLGTIDRLVVIPEVGIEMVAADGRRAVLRSMALPGPLHMGAALLRYRHLEAVERWRLVFGAARLVAMTRRDRAVLERMTVAELMDHLGQGERARRCFWYPLAIAVLNEEPALASAALLGEVVRRAFFGRRRDSSIIYARVGLSELYCEAALAAIKAKGGTVILHCAVERLEVEDATVSGAVLRDGRRLAADYFVLAVPPQSVLRLLPAALAGNRDFARLAELGSSPIVCLHAWFDREITRAPVVGFIDTTVQWMFNKRRIFAPNGGPGRPGYLSFVMSGARSQLEVDNDALVATVLSDLRQVLPASRSARLLRAMPLKEKHATIAVSPASNRLRPATATALSNLFLAGDWIDTGLPPTIESAVETGHRAAAAIGARLGRPRGGYGA